MKVVIGIPTYNGAQRLDDLLTSISLRTPFIGGGDVGIVLVDDGSPRVEETRVVADRWTGKLPLTYVEHGMNRGISASWNTASRATDASIIVLVNDDVIVSLDWLAPLVYALEHSPGVGVVGANWHAFTREDVPQLLSDDRGVIPRDPLSKAQDPGRRGQEDTWPGRVMCPTGQLFAFRREDFDAIGGFDEEFKSFFEESSFGTSMAAQLHKIGLQLTWPYNWHLWSATFASSPELRAGERMLASREHYKKKWNVPDGAHEFEYTNPKYLGAIGDVPIQFIRRDGPWRGVLRQDCAFVDGEKI